MSIISYRNDLHKDTNVYGDSVYYGNGQGCGTIWYKSIDHAREVARKSGKVPQVPKSYCKKCSCYYSYGTKNWKKYPEYNCAEYKRNIVKISK